MKQEIIILIKSSKNPFDVKLMIAMLIAKPIAIPDSAQLKAELPLFKILISLYLLRRKYAFIKRIKMVILIEKLII